MGAAKRSKGTAAKRSTKSTAAPKKATKRATAPTKAPPKKKTAKKVAAKKAATKKVTKPATKQPAKKTTAKKAAPARAEKKTTAAKTPAPTATTRSENLPETQPQPRVKTARRSKAAKTVRAGSKKLPLVTTGAAPDPARAKRRRDKKARPPAKTMSAPEPIREVLVFEEMPDVRRARSAIQRREGSRGHLQPNVADGSEGFDGPRQPLDATLIMNTLAVDVQPKIEDNYDYSVLEEFSESGFCPRATRMVNTGCGGGEAAVHFAKRGFSCVGIDPDRADVGLARERAWLAGVDIDFMVGDLFETPNLLPAESFGLSVDRGAFFQIEDERERQRYLSNVKRLLFKGGIMLLSAGYFPLEDEGAPRKVRSKPGANILLASEGGVVVQEMRAAGFALLKRVLRQTADSGELGELILYLQK